MKKSTQIRLSSRLKTTGQSSTVLNFLSSCYTPEKHFNTSAFAPDVFQLGCVLKWSIATNFHETQLRPTHFGDLDKSTPINSRLGRWHHAIKIIDSSYYNKKEAISDATIIVCFGFYSRNNLKNHGSKSVESCDFKVSDEIQFHVRVIWHPKP